MKNLQVDATQNLNPLTKTVVGVQFLFVAFGATVLVPILAGLDPATALFSAGIGTLIFHFVTKGMVPIFLGSSFAYIAPIILSSQKWGLSGTLTAFIGVALVYFVVSAVIKWRGTGFLNKVFPPVVVGPTIMLIGFSLAPTAVNMASSDWLLSIISLVVAIIVMTFGKGLFKLFPVMVGIFASYIVAACLGKVDFTTIQNAPWFALPKNIAEYHLPSFKWQPFLCMLPIAFASIIEHVGDIYVIGNVAKKDFIKNPGLHRTLLGDGLAILAGAFVGGPPVTTYSEVTGAVQITKVTNPQVLRITAVTAILFSVVGKLNAFLQSIPSAVLGGIMIILFGSIASVGMRNIVENKVNFEESRNIIIAGVMIVLGIGGAVINAGSLTLSGLALSCLVGILLNLLLPSKTTEKPEKES